MRRGGCRAPVRDRLPARRPPGRPLRRPPAQPADAPDDPDTPEGRAAWQAAREALLRRQSRPAAVAATALARVAKEEAGDAGGADGAGEPWRRSRGGTSLGRAVHAVLQTADLATGAGLEAAARTQAAAERIPRREAEIVRLARAALGSAAVRRAVASGRFWREVPAAAPAGPGVLEGIVDLLFEEPDGLVVVDYKTDALDRAGGVEQAVARYRLQADAYALALQRATGRVVKEAALLFLRPRREVSLGEVAQLAGAARRQAEEALGGGPGVGHEP